MRDWLGAIVKLLFPDPIVTIRGSHCVDVNVNTIDAKLAVNLVNTSGPHADTNTIVFDEIPEIGPLEVTIRHPRRPKQVLMQPGGRALEWDYGDGAIRLTLPKVQIHCAVVVED